jgi:hypothetical protein
MVKRLLLNTSGFAFYVGAPLIPVIQYWGFLTQTDAKTTISSGVMFVLILSIPVFKYILGRDKLPFDVNYTWLIIGAVAGAFMYIAQQVFIIACFGAGGSILGSFLFKQADRIKEMEKQAKALNNALKK